ncbi:hypothetical protein K1719_039447 [Acacia pycnantha]|nr:hypothetical protein K1719_039447 [Acacia pycnantha]
MWAKLVENETGLGWDSGKNTIMAPPEWWEAKGKEDPKYLNWKEQGPKFLSLMETCFKDVVALGYVVFKPRKQILPPRKPWIMSQIMIVILQMKGWVKGILRNIPWITIRGQEKGRDGGKERKGKG